MDHPASDSAAHSDMECTVCFKYFDCPKLLPCGHLLCRDCLIDFLASQTEAKCHLCRCAIVEPTGTGERSLEDIADGFPTDLATRALVRAHRWLSQEHRCCVCADVTAVCTCLDCSDVFCESCGNVHRKQSATKRHNVQNLSVLTAHKLVSDGRGTCRKHPCDIPVLFCSTHGVSICPTCFATEHRSCPEVTELTAKMEKTRAVMEELVNTLSAGEVAMECAMKRMEMRLRDTERRWEEADAQVEEACDRLEAAVKERRRYLRELALKERNDAKDVIQQQCAQLSHRRGKLTSHKIVAQRAEGLAAPDWFDDMVTAMKERVHDLDRSTTLPNAKVIPSATFTIDPDVVSSIVDQLSTLGQVKPVPVKAPSACARSEVIPLRVVSSLLSFSLSSLCLGYSVFLGWSGGPWGRGPFNTSDLWFGTLFLSLSGIRLHSLFF